jgi:3-oxoacyl-[acyl-carrier protein] reductase
MQGPEALVPRGRSVIVTGAAGGLGRAIATMLAQCECRLALCDVAESIDRPLDGALESRVARHERFDLRDPAATRAAVERMVEAMEGCDAVVANAGVTDTVHRAERFSDEDWERDIDTNLSAQFRVLRAVFPALAAAADGRAVVISSAAALTGLPGQVAYAAAKEGLVGMVRTLASEWAAHGIRCNVVMPGMVATPRVRALPDDVLDRLAGSVPLQRIAEPHEVAGVVAFLLSPCAAYITGSVLRVDGGHGLALRGIVR